MGDVNLEVSRTHWIREQGLKFLAPGALVILYIFFGLFGRNYFSYPTLVNIIDAAFYIGFISMGVTFVIISGGIDLSIEEASQEAIMEYATMGHQQVLARS